MPPSVLDELEALAGTEAASPAAGNGVGPGGAFVDTPSGFVDKELVQRDAPSITADAPVSPEQVLAQLDSDKAYLGRILSGPFGKLPEIEAAVRAARRALDRAEKAATALRDVDPAIDFTGNQTQRLLSAMAAGEQGLADLGEAVERARAKQPTALTKEQLDEIAARTELAKANAGLAAARTREIKVDVDEKIARQAILQTVREQFDERVEQLQGLSGQALAQALDTLRLEFAELLKDPELFLETLDAQIQIGRASCRERV